MSLEPLLLGELPGAEVAGVWPLVAVAQHVALHRGQPQLGLQEEEACYSLTYSV